MFPACALFFFFFNDTATTEIYTLSLHDALPIRPPTRHRLRPALQAPPPVQPPGRRGPTRSKSRAPTADPPRLKTSQSRCLITRRYRAGKICVKRLRRQTLE